VQVVGRIGGEFNPMFLGMISYGPSCIFKTIEIRDIIVSELYRTIPGELRPCLTGKSPCVWIDGFFEGEFILRSNSQAR
jgi:hypothetical protein